MTTLTAAGTTAAPASPPSLATRAWHGSRRFRPVLVLDIAMLAVFSVINDDYLSLTNVRNLLTAVAIIWLVAMGATFVLLSGGFDLSSAAVAAVAGIALAKLLAGGVPGWAAIVMTVGLGALIGGGVNGVLIGRLRLSVFVVTLATMTALTGVATLWSDTQTLPVTDPTVFSLIADRFAGLPVVIWLMLLTFAVMLYVQTRTHFGRDVLAVGGSPMAASLSGIRTDRVLIGVYGLAGALAALGGVIAAGRIGGAAPQVDGSLTLSAIAAVLIGGTSLAGGLGGVGGTLCGVLFVALLQNGLSLSGVATYWQQVITGVILVLAVLGDRLDLGSTLRRARDRRATTGAG